MFIDVISWIFALGFSAFIYVITLLVIYLHSWQWAADDYGDMYLAKKSWFVDTESFAVHGFLILAQFVLVGVTILITEWGFLVFLQLICIAINIGLLTDFVINSVIEEE